MKLIYPLAIGLAAWTSSATAQTLAFPFKAEDLPAGVRIATQPHASGIQGSGLDLTARRYLSGDDWSSRNAGQSATNASAVVYGLPFYAMADGEVIGCWRNAPENPPGGSHPERANGRILGGGNFLWVRHDDGQVALYAHAIPGSIPASLCPNDAVLVPAEGGENQGNPDVDPRAYVPSGVVPTTPTSPEVRRPQIRRGQMLGRVGNSGASSGPHLHVHMETGFDGRSRPAEMRFERGLWTPRTDNEADINDWQSFSGQPVPARQVLIWPPRTLSREYARHQFPAADLQRQITHLSNSGYMPEVLDCYGVGGQLFFNMVWRPATGRWSAVAGVPEQRYQQAFDAAGSLSPTFVDACSSSSGPRYTAIFREAPGAFVARHDLSLSGHEELLDEMIDGGFVPASVAVISAGGERRYTVLYRERNAGEWRLRSRLVRAGDADQYDDFIDEATAVGLVPIFVNAYMHDGRQNFVVLVSRQPDGPWVARHDMNGEQYAEEWRNRTGEGLMTRGVTAFDGTNNAHVFAGIWSRQ